MFEISVEAVADDRLKLIHRPDVSLSKEEDQRLRRLLFGCFPHEPTFLSRRFLRQCPAHRWLVLDPAGEIVAHLAVLEKWIGTERGDLKIGGVAEVCVATAYRRHRQAARLIRAAHDWMRGNGFEFAMLFGQPDIYQSSGYALIENEIAATNSLARHWNPFCGKPMIHRLSDKPWPEGRIDLRGPTF